jgi:hypothetical protein
MTIQHIADLNPDPKNARKHTPRNIGMIATSLQEVGAARSIVIDEDNNILAGNGTIEAAAQVGITKMQIVDTDGETIVAVRRSGLNKKQKKRLALFDNRTAETAEWDKDVLQSIYDEDDSILEGLWKDSEVPELLGQLSQIVYQVIPLAFLPSEVSEIEEAWTAIGAAYGDADSFWIARFKDYDRIINGLSAAGARKDLKYINQALLYLIRFWKEHYVPVP